MNGKEKNKMSLSQYIHFGSYIRLPDGANYNEALELVTETFDGDEKFTVIPIENRYYIIANQSNLGGLDISTQISKEYPSKFLDDGIKRDYDAISAGAKMWRATINKFPGSVEELGILVYWL